MRWLLIALLLLASCSGQVESEPSEPTEEPFYAWDFTLTALDGSTYTLSALQGQWVVVNFWATWCAPCVEEMPILQAIHDEYDNLTVLGINQRETEQEIHAFLDENRLNFPILINPTDQVVLDYNVIGLPQTLVVDPDGIIVWRQFGPVELETFRAQVDDLLNS